MEKAKQVARDFLSGDGTHKTTVDQDVKGAVTEEHVRPEKHENVTTAVQKDVHQDHHQTRIQPIQHKESLPEKHKHNVIPVEHKTVEHGNAQEHDQRLQQEAGQFRNTSTTDKSVHTSSVAPTVTGERVHHHVHEHIQPVIQKETIAPETVHTTVPIHETHHVEPVHHDTTTLPTKTLSEFAGSGGGETLKGRGAHALNEYEGSPQPLRQHTESQRVTHGENLGGNTTTSGENFSSRGSENQSYGGQYKSTDIGAGAAGSTGYGAGSADRSRNTNVEASGRNNALSDSGSTGRKGVNTGGLGSSAAGVPAGIAGKSGDHHYNTRNSGTMGSTDHSKPSMMDKLNPRKDADGDGKTGIMD